MENFNVSQKVAALVLITLFMAALLLSYFELFGFTASEFTV